MKIRYRKLELVACPVCMSTQYYELFDSYDDRYGYNDYFTICKCEQCKCTFVKNPVNKKSLGDLYEHYYHSENYSEGQKNKIGSIGKIILFLKIRKIIDFFTGNIQLGYFIKKGNKVLDIGCGTELNAFLSGIKKQDRIGLDVDKSICDKIQSRGYKCYHGDLEDIDQIKESFDLILMSQVIEHVYNPTLMLQNAKKLLNPGGKIIICTPNVDSTYKKQFGQNRINWHVPYHTILFGKNTFEFLGNNVGLSIENSFTITPTNWFLLQKHYKKPDFGVANEGFKFSLSIILILYYSLYLRLRDLIRGTGDCIYVTYKKKEF